LARETVYLTPKFKSVNSMLHFFVYPIQLELCDCAGLQLSESG
jgi:hypothetical protein